MTNTQDKQDKNVAPKADEHESRLRELEIQQKELELLSARANLQDLQERLAEREMKRETARMKAITNGATIKQLNNEKAMKQRRCNHRKGGDGANGVVGGKGDGNQYAVIKHSMANGDLWVICLRCGKHWKPPFREQFETDSAFFAAKDEYMTATQFSTLNKPSGSARFSWSDDGQFYRESVANS